MNNIGYFEGGSLRVTRYAVRIQLALVRITADDLRREHRIYDDLMRSAVGPDFAIMVDPACELRTWSDALKLGLACDEANCLWYEDPYRDAGGSSLGHQRLREKIGTPLRRVHLRIVR